MVHSFFLQGVLEHTHKLIDTMVDMALMKQAIKPLLSAIELSQYMTQVRLSWLSVHST